MQARATRRPLVPSYVLTRTLSRRSRLVLSCLSHSAGLSLCLSTARSTCILLFLSLSFSFPLRRVYALVRRSTLLSLSLTPLSSSLSHLRSISALRSPRSSSPLLLLTERRPSSSSPMISDLPRSRSPLPPSPPAGHKSYDLSRTVLLKAFSVSLLTIRPCFPDRCRTLPF